MVLAKSGSGILLNAVRRFRARRLYFPGQSGLNVPVDSVQIGVVAASKLLWNPSRTDSVLAMRLDRLTMGKERREVVTLMTTEIVSNETVTFQ